MTKVASAFYSTAVALRDVDGLYRSSFGIPGIVPQWVNGTDGKPKIFRSAEEAELIGFRNMVARLNGARHAQTFHVKGSNGNKQTRSWSAAPEKGPTIESVFGKNGK